jgi:hypothetical protein
MDILKTIQKKQLEHVREINSPKDNSKDKVRIILLGFI